MWTPKLSSKKLSDLPVGIFASGFFLDGMSDSVWVANKNEDNTWTIKYEHLDSDSNWYAENKTKKWDSWRKDEEKKIAESGKIMKIMSRVQNLIKVDDSDIIKYYRK